MDQGLSVGSENPPFGVIFAFAGRASESAWIRIGSGLDQGFLVVAFSWQGRWISLDRDLLWVGSKLFGCKLLLAKPMS